MKNSHHWGPLQRQLHRVVSSTPFEVLVATVVMSQMAVSIKQTDLDAQEADIPASMQALSVLFLIIYLVELGLRLYIYRWDFFKSRWHLLDIGVISFDAISLLISKATNSHTTSFAVLRVFRVFRVVRAARLLKMCPELFIMVHSLAGTVRVVFWAGLLVTMMTTVWSMIAVDIINPLSLELNAGDEECKNAFGSVYQSNLLFLQTIVAGDSFGRCTMPIMREEAWTVLFFMAVLSTVGLGALNLILSAIVDRATEVRAENEQLLHISKMKTFEAAKKRLGEVFREELDPDADGNLSLDEILNALEASAEFAEAFETLGLGKSDICTVFYMMDEQRTGSVPFDEFSDHLLKLKTEDQHMLLILIKQFMNDARHTIQEEFELMKTEQVELQEIMRSVAILTTGRSPSKKSDSKAGSPLSACPKDQQEPGGPPLMACVNSATGLRNADWIGKSDPYVIVQLFGKDGKKKGEAKQTCCKKDTLEPVWDEVFEFREYTAGDELLFEVFDRDIKLTRPDDLLGKVRIDADQVSSGLNGDIILAEAGKTQGKAKLTLRIQPPKIPSKGSLPSQTADTDPFCIAETSNSDDIHMLLNNLLTAQLASNETLAALQKSSSDMSFSLQSLQIPSFSPETPVIEPSKIAKEPQLDMYGVDTPPPLIDSRLTLRGSTKASWPCCRAQQPVVHMVPSQEASNQ